MALFTYPELSIDTTGLATEAKQDAMIAELVIISADTTSIDAKVSTEAKQDDVIAELTSIDAKVSTEAKQDDVITQLTNLNSKINGDLYAIDHDYRDVSYVAAGVGIGQPSTVVLRSGGSTGPIVRTITFTYTTNATADEVVDTIGWS